MNRYPRPSAGAAASPEQPAATPLHGLEAAPPRRAPKQNKLAFKHRWLLSRDIVATLARAGVDCNIIIPCYDGRRH